MCCSPCACVGGKVDVCVCSSSVSDEFSKCNLACRRIWLDNQSKSPPRGPVEEIFLTSWECSSSVLVIVMFNSEFLSSLFCLCIIRSLYLQSSHIKPCVKSCVALGSGISMHIDQEITSKCIRTIFNLPRHSNDLLFAPDRIHWNCSYYGNAAVSLVDGQFVSKWSNHAPALHPGGVGGEPGRVIVVPERSHQSKCFHETQLLNTSTHTHTQIHAC